MTDSTLSRAKGSFRIPKEALKLLVNKKATAWEIGTYLALARFTDETGKYSTAGFKAVSEATGASSGTENTPGPARRNVENLLKITRGTLKEQPKRGRPKKLNPMKLVYKPEDWTATTGEALPEAPHERATVRWVLNDFGTTEWVWFPNDLIDGVGRFTQPLKRLKQCGDIAARLLLLLYEANNPEEFGGVPPYQNVYEIYAMEYLVTCHGTAFWQATHKSVTAYNSIALPSIGIHSFSNDKKTTEQQWKPFWDARASLESQGFIYQAVTVMDGSYDNNDNASDVRPIYELAVRTKHGHPPKGEEGLAHRVEQVFKAVTGQTTADTLGRFQGVFPVISRAGIKPHVVGAYRLHFRISNPKNHTVTAGWKRRERDQADAIEMLEYLEQQYGIKAPEMKAKADEIH